MPASAVLPRMKKGDDRPEGRCHSGKETNRRDACPTKSRARPVWNVTGQKVKGPVPGRQTGTGLSQTKAAGCWSWAGAVGVAVC